MTGTRQLVVVTRRDCELCSELMVLLQPFEASGVIAIEERDVDADATLHARYCYRVPVVLEGESELLWGRIEAPEVAAVLGSPAAAGPNH